MCHQQWAYKYQSVRRWSKNIPGKNIFALDRIFFPINRGCMYWMCAVIFMQKKKMDQFFDSMGSDGKRYTTWMPYSSTSKMNMSIKKKHPYLIDDWVLVQNQRETPRQCNGKLFYLFHCLFWCLCLYVDIIFCYSCLFYYVFMLTFFVTTFDVFQ